MKYLLEAGSTCALPHRKHGQSGQCKVDGGALVGHAAIFTMPGLAIGNEHRNNGVVHGQSRPRVPKKNKKKPPPQV
jgi:hypothetical protein